MSSEDIDVAIARVVKQIITLYEEQVEGHVSLI